MDIRYKQMLLIRYHLSEYEAFVEYVAHLIKEEGYKTTTTQKATENKEGFAILRKEQKLSTQKPAAKEVAQN